MPPLIAVHGVTAGYTREPVLDAVDLEVGSGEIVTLIGPNGSGKTTLVRVALGLTRVERGRVVRRPGLRIGYVPQHLRLEPSMPLTVARFLDLGRRSSRARIDAALAEVGTSELANHAMTSLSGGEARRVLLARALLQEPRLLVLDEPTAGIDVAGQEDFYRLIERLRAQRGCGVLLVSHDLHLVMATTDRVVCLNRHVCCAGTPDDIRGHPEYLTLFAAAVTPGLAVYTHQHDHAHDLHGDVRPATETHYEHG